MFVRRCKLVWFPLTSLFVILTQHHLSHNMTRERKRLVTSRWRFGVGNTKLQLLTGLINVIYVGEEASFRPGGGSWTIWRQNKWLLVEKSSFRKLDDGGNRWSTEGNGLTEEVSAPPSVCWTNLNIVHITFLPFAPDWQAAFMWVCVSRGETHTLSNSGDDSHHLLWLFFYFGDSILTWFLCDSLRLTSPTWRSFVSSATLKEPRMPRFHPQQEYCPFYSCATRKKEIILWSNVRLLIHICMWGWKITETVCCVCSSSAGQQVSLCHREQTWLWTFFGPWTPWTTEMFKTLLVKLTAVYASEVVFESLITSENFL